MSDPRDDAFRWLLEAVRRFNRKASMERRDVVELAAARLVQAHAEAGEDLMASSLERG